VDKITARDTSDEPPSTQGVASTKLARKAQRTVREAGGKNVRHVSASKTDTVSSYDPEERAISV